MKSTNRRVSPVAGLGRHQKTPDLAGKMETVSQTHRPGSQHGSVAALSSEERALEERLRDYRELLNHLRDH